MLQGVHGGRTLGTEACRRRASAGFSIPEGSGKGLLYACYSHGGLCADAGGYDFYYCEFGSLKCCSTGLPGLVIGVVSTNSVAWIIDILLRSGNWVGGWGVYICSVDIWDWY